MSHVKVHRVVLSILDFENMPQSDVVALLEQAKFLYPSVLKIETREVCKRKDWEDDNPFNKNSSCLEEFDEKFNTLKSNKK